jgi:hypothetical protein
MKAQWIVIIILILVITLYLTRNKIKSAMTRAYINNNPGNIRPTNPPDNPWLGEVRPSTDKGFRQFQSMPLGYRAMFINLKGYLAHGINTIQKIISTWAPSSDNNNTAAYITAVANKVGKNPTDIISWPDTATIRKIVIAISEQESGIPANTDDVDQGYKLLNI